MVAHKKPSLSDEEFALACRMRSGQVPKGKKWARAIAGARTIARAISEARGAHEASTPEVRRKREVSGRWVVREMEKRGAWKSAAVEQPAPLAEVSRQLPEVCAIQDPVWHQEGRSQTENQSGRDSEARSIEAVAKGQVSEPVPANQEVPR